MSLLSTEHSRALSQVTPVATSPHDPRPTFLVLGDSIALGASAIEGTAIRSRIARSFVEQLESEFTAWRFSVDAAPLRTTQFTASCIVETLDRHRPSAVLMATGANDVDIDWRRFVLSEGKVVRSRTPLQVYTQSMLRIVRESKSRGIPVILTDTFSSNLQIRMDNLCRVLGRDIRQWVAQAGGQPVCDSIVHHYRAAALDVAAQTASPLCPFGSHFDRGVISDMLADDGTHPNQLGHDVLARIAIATIAQHLPAPRVAGVA